MTQLSDIERQAQMADMKSFDEQMPCVGIFWYDPEEHSFFGVHKKEITPKMVEEAADNGIPFINYPKLHRQIWAKEYFRHDTNLSPVTRRGLGASVRQLERLTGISRGIIQIAKS